MIYEYTLDEDHDYFCEGVPAILRTNLKMTRDIYATCTIPVVVNIALTPSIELRDTLESMFNKIKLFRAIRDRRGMSICTIYGVDWVPQILGDFVEDAGDEFNHRAWYLANTGRRYPQLGITATICIE